MNIRTTLCVSVFALTAIAGAASATTTADFKFNGSTAFGTKNLAENVSIEVGGKDSSARAGLLDLKDSVSGKAISAFCVDVFHNLGNPPGKYEVTATSWFSSTVTSNVTKLFNTAYKSVNTAAEAAGFQMALWEIVTETNKSLDLDSGYFEAKSGFIFSNPADNFADSYLHGLNGTATGSYTLTFLKSLSSPLGQNLITVDNLGGDSQTPAPVPLPASVLLLAGGLAGLGGVARKKRKAS